MSTNTQALRCRPSSSVSVLSERLLKYVRKNSITVPPQEVVWMRNWAMVASGKLGKNAVETVNLKELLIHARAYAYEKKTTKQRKAMRKS